MAAARPNWFIALPVAAGPWLEALSPAPPEVRLFAASDLHATVAFLGGVQERAARRAFALAPSWPTGPLGVRLGGVRGLGARRKPSALSALLEANAERVADGIAAVRAPMLAAAGARPDDRPPLPHVTLARIGRRADARQRRAALDWAEALDLGSPRVRLDRLALYTWAPDRRERLFEIVAEHTLQST